MEKAVAIRPPEREIYKRIWDNPRYREVSPGEMAVPTFLQQARPRVGATVIDFGCGTGRASLLMALPPPAGASLNVTMLDFADNCLDEDIRGMLEAQSDVLRFYQADLTEKIKHKATYGYCVDVMEHIAPENVGTVLNSILMAAPRVFFSIATEEDRLGVLVGHPLHLTVRSYEWWLEQFRSRECVIHWSAEFSGGCAFYVSAWAGAEFLQEKGDVNLSEEKIGANIAHNTAQDWKQCYPHEINKFECVILGGGPSLNDHLDEIKELRTNPNVKLITMNNSYNWALENGLKPSATVIVDAREHNARFARPVIDDCVYLISSQCDPSVLEGLPKEMTYLWHVAGQKYKDIYDAAYSKKWWSVLGGSTVLLRTIPLLRTLGYRRFHLFGCDSCVTEKEHHAYAQAENDREYAFRTVLTVAGVPTDREFLTTNWQVVQAHEFIGMVQFMCDDIDMQVHGDGLLAYILRTGAEISTEDKE